MYQPWCDGEYSKPVVLFKLKIKDARAAEVVNRCLPIEVSEDVDDFEFGQDLDIVQTLATGTKTQIMYVSLMSVIMEEGKCGKDRFIKDSHFLSMLELTNIQANEDSEVTLASMLQQVYKKISVIFRSELRHCTESLQLFWLYRNVFSSALLLLKMYARDGYSQIHTKSILTLILKQKDFKSLRRHAFS